jgi:hypothetical protein
MNCPYVFATPQGQVDSLLGYLPGCARNSKRWRIKLKTIRNISRKGAKTQSKLGEIPGFKAIRRSSPEAAQRNPGLSPEIKFLRVVRAFLEKRCCLNAGDLSSVIPACFKRESRRISD